MKQILLAAIAAGLVVSAGTASAQTPAKSTDRDRSGEMKQKVKNALKDTDVTYGRVKELTAGKNVVIDVDNAPDKSFDLADKGVAVHLAKGLKVGDPVRVREHEVAGKTKSVTITKHAGKGVVHGDKDPNKK